MEVGFFTIKSPENKIFIIDINLAFNEENRMFFILGPLKRIHAMYRFAPLLLLISNICFAGLFDDIDAAFVTPIPMCQQVFKMKKKSKHTYKKREDIDRHIEDITSIPEEKIKKIRGIVVNEVANDTNVQAQANCNGWTKESCTQVGSGIIALPTLQWGTKFCTEWSGGEQIKFGTCMMAAGTTSYAVVKGVCTQLCHDKHLIDCRD